MLSKKYTWFLLIAFLFPLKLFAKDITGVWKGDFYVDSTKKTYPFELSISENKGKLTGYSRISFTEDGTPEVVFREQTIKKEGDTYIIEDKNQLSKASSIAQPKEVKKTMIVMLTIEDSVMILKGDWSTNKTRKFLAARGTVQVQRKNDFRETAIFKKLDELQLTKDFSFNKPEEKPEVTPKKVPSPEIVINVPVPEKPKEPVIVKPEVKPVVKTPPPAIEKVAPPKPQPVKVAKAKPIVKAAPVAVVPKPVAPAPKPVVVVPASPKPVPAQAMVSVSKNAAVEVNQRTNSSIQSIYYKSDSLQLTLYDNGEVDGDTVSVLLNGKVIIANARLDIKPNVHTIYFDKNTPDSMMLVMYAENLGSIPPNPGLLVIHDGKAIYEVRFSADLSNNAAIILRRKKDE
jgi:hypothetical protein